MIEMKNFDIMNNIVNGDAGAVNDFGTAIACNSTTIAVTAPNDSSGGTGTGCIFLYELDGTFRSKLIGGNSTRFVGDYIAMDDNYIVSSKTGTVVVFTVDGTFVSSIEGPQVDRFGNAIAVNGGLIYVGASLNDAAGSNSGVMYVYKPDGTLLKTITNPSSTAEEQFGASIAVSNSVIVVTATDVNTYNQPGTVYVFDKQYNLLWSESHPNQYGYNVVCNDSYIAISTRESVSGHGAGGMVRVYDIAHNLYDTIVNSTVSNNDNFGLRLDISDSSIALGSYGIDSVNSEAGLVSVYDIATKTLTNVPLSVTGTNSEMGGNGVAINDDRVIAASSARVSLGMITLNFLTPPLFEALTIPTGISTIGNSTTAKKLISTVSPSLKIVKTIDKGQWKSWSNDAPTEYQGILNIEPGRGYVVDALADFSFKLKGSPLDFNTIPILTGYNMLAMPSSLSIGNGFAPRIAFDTVKSIDGVWKSWTKGAAAGFQGFTSFGKNKGYVTNVTQVYGDVVTASNTTDGVSVAAGDTSVTDGVAAEGVLLTAPGLTHTVSFTKVVYDQSVPANTTFYNIAGAIGKLDYPSELEGSAYSITDDGTVYSAVFNNAGTYTAPITADLGSGVTITKIPKTVATGSVYSTMNLIVDGVSNSVSVAAEYIGDTFQVWKNGDMREAVFAAGNVTVTFV